MIEALGCHSIQPCRSKILQRQCILVLVTHIRWGRHSNHHFGARIQEFQKFSSLDQQFSTDKQKSTKVFQASDPQETFLLSSLEFSHVSKTVMSKLGLSLLLVLLGTQSTHSPGLARGNYSPQTLKRMHFKIPKFQ